MSQLTAHEVVARNLPEHARNAIHTDVGAKAAGFPRALVAGVTTYAYLCAVPLRAWGEEWLRSGGGEVRFRAPVFDGDVVRCVPRGHRVDAVTTSTRAMLDLDEFQLPSIVDGDELGTVTVTLHGEFGAGYASNAGDPDPVCAGQGLVHPAVWPALANTVVHAQLARGSWIHTRSRIKHHDIARQGEVATVRSQVVDRFHRSGERAVLRVSIDVAGRPVASIEHEAIIDLGTSA